MTFDHQDIRERVVEHLSGELDDEARAAFEAHLAGCASCREETDGLAKARTVAREVVRAGLGDEVPRGLRARVLEAAAAAARERAAAESTTTVAAAAAAAIAAAGPPPPSPRRSAARPQAESAARPRAESSSRTSRGPEKPAGRGWLDWLRGHWTFPTFATVAAMAAFLLVRGTIFREARQPLGESPAERLRASSGAAAPSGPPAGGSLPKPGSSSIDDERYLHKASSAELREVVPSELRKGGPGSKPSADGALEPGASRHRTGGTGVRDRDGGGRTHDAVGAARGGLAREPSSGRGAPANAAPVAQPPGDDLLSGLSAGPPAKARARSGAASGTRKDELDEAGGGPPPPSKPEVSRRAAEAKKSAPAPSGVADTQEFAAPPPPQAAGAPAAAASAPRSAPSREEEAASPAGGGRMAKKEKAQVRDEAEAPPSAAASPPAAPPAARRATDKAPSAERPSSAAADDEGIAATGSASSDRAAASARPASPDPVRALIDRADKLWTARRWTEAGAAYRDLLRRFPDHASAPLWRARVATADRADAGFAAPPPPR